MAACLVNGMREGVDDKNERYFLLQASVACEAVWNATGRAPESAEEVLQYCRSHARVVPPDVVDYMSRNLFKYYRLDEDRWIIITLKRDVVVRIVERRIVNGIRYRVAINAEWPLEFSVKEEGQ